MLCNPIDIDTLSMYIWRTSPEVHIIRGFVYYIKSIAKNISLVELYGYSDSTKCNKLAIAKNGEGIKAIYGIL